LDFAFDPSVAATLRNVGFQALSQANNHQLDQGRDGAKESREALQRVGISVFGDQVKDDAAVATTIIDARGTRVALLGFNITDNPLDKPAAEKALTDARASADLVIVMPHWGVEYESTPQPSVRDLGHWFVNHGADVVIGSHPHWMQSVEVYNGHPIAYSLGNFVFDQDWSKETNEALTLSLEIGKTSHVLRFHPIRLERSQPRFLDGEDRRLRLEHLAEISDPILRGSILDGRLLLQNP
jgi:poly-gamma-glutamate synthesis protein (capsule biosynthesis protein)